MSSYRFTQLLATATNPYVWDDSAKYINTPIITLDLFGAEEQPITVQELANDITIDISVDATKMRANRISFPLAQKDALSYHKFNVRSNFSSVHMIVVPENASIEMECYIRFGDNPSDIEYDFNITLPRNVSDFVDPSETILAHELSFTIFLPPEYIQQYGPGLYYIGIRPVCKLLDI